MDHVRSRAAELSVLRVRDGGRAAGLDRADGGGQSPAGVAGDERLPEDPHGWRWLGRSLDALGDPGAAREALERALELAVTAELPADERASLQERIEADLKRLAEQGE